MSANQAYVSIIGHYCSQSGLDPALVEAVLTIESNGQPNAQSHAGAMGLMQLMPDTCTRCGVVDPFDPDQNIRGGVYVLAQNFLRYNGDLSKTIAAYNAGPRHADDGSWTKMAGTSAYVQQVLAIYSALKADPPATPAIIIAPPAQPNAPIEHFVDEMFAAIKASQGIRNQNSLAENGLLDDTADTLMGDYVAGKLRVGQMQRRANEILRGTPMGASTVTAICITTPDSPSFPAAWAKQASMDGRVVGLSHGVGVNGHVWIILVSS